MFGRRSRAEKLARNGSLVSGATLAGVVSGARPVGERLLYDDDLRDNVRTLLEAGRKIVDEVSDESPVDVVKRLWDDPKLRREVEAAAGAAQEGYLRMQGKRVRGSGSGRRLLILALLGGAIFLSPQTGPQARRVVGDLIGSLRSGS